MTTVPATDPALLSAAATPNDCAGSSTELLDTVAETVAGVVAGVVEGAGTAMTEAVDTLVEGVRDQLATVKPKLRGWLHLGAVPVALLAGLALTLAAPTSNVRAAVATYAAAAAAQYAVSAAYNIGTWGPRTALLLRRLDHCGIFILIAGSYTPFAVLFLTGHARTQLLTIAWAGAGIGAVFKAIAPNVPRWVSVPVYFVLGGVCVLYAPAFARTATTTELALLAAGGLVYTLGAVVYSIRRPNLSPTWFGFHELFHAATLLAFAAHFTAIALAVHALTATHARP